MLCPGGKLLIGVAILQSSIAAQVPDHNVNRSHPAPLSASTKPNVAKVCIVPGLGERRLQEATDAASALQAPLAADALIRIATKIARACPKLAESLLSQAFDVSQTVEPEIGQHGVLQDGYVADSRVQYASHAYDLQMDRLSLEGRAVSALSALDAKAAGLLFQRISPPRPDRVSCTSAFVPDVSLFYEALDKLLPRLRTLPGSATESTGIVPDLQEIASRTASPVQIAPLAKVIVNANPSGPELASLLNALAAALENLPADENSFFDGGTFPSVKAKNELLRLAAQKHVASFPLSRTFHDFLQRNLDGPHCEQAVRKDFPALIRRYQSFNRSAVPSDEMESLSVTASDPVISKGPDEGEYWLSPKTQALLTDAKHLNFDDKWKPFTDSQRNTPEWRDRVQHLLDDMEDWRPADEKDPADYYHQRCMLLYETLSKLPPGTLYDQVLSTWIRTLEDSSLQVDNPAAWYFEISRLLNFSRLDEKAPIPPAVISALKNSPNNYLRALGTLAEFFQ